MSEMLFKCLFDLSDYSNMKLIKSNSAVKCKTDESRKEAYKLLSILCKNDPKNIQNLFQNYLSVLLESTTLTDSDKKINSQ